MPDDTLQLTAAIAAGDARAFERLYRERFEVLYAWARRATGRDESFCLDVVQDAMLRVVRSMRPIESEPELAAWLRRVLLTSAYDRLRRETRRQRRERAAAEHAFHTDDGVNESDGERIAWLHEQIAAFDDPTAALLIARYRFGWTLARIGAAFGLRPGAVDGRLARAAATLRSRAHHRRMGVVDFRKQHETHAPWTPLSAQGVARREAMLGDLVGEVERLRRGRALRARAAAAAACVAVAGGALFVAWPGVSSLWRQSPGVQIAAAPAPTNAIETAGMSEIASAGAHEPEAPSAPAPMIVPASMIRIVRTDAEIVQRLSFCSDGAFAAAALAPTCFSGSDAYAMRPSCVTIEIIDDSELARLLAAMGRPAGVIRSQGRVWLTAAVTDRELSGG